MRVCEEHHRVFDDTEECVICGTPGIKITAIDDSRDKPLRFECLKLAVALTGRGGQKDVVNRASQFYDFVSDNQKGNDSCRPLHQAEDGDEKRPEENQYLNKEAGQEEGSRDPTGGSYARDRSQRTPHYNIETGEID